VSRSIFSPALFKFLSELRANNDREWFEANRSRYESELLEPALDFIEAFAPHLRRISPNFVASTSRTGGSLFRIHRDIRFSKDKSPYKTYLGIRFPHKEARNVHSPGFYLHIEPRECFMGAGIWHPDSTTLTKIRGAIVSDPGKWKRVTQAKKFSDVYRLSGDSLTRAPTGYDRDHPFVEDLKRKDFIGITSIPQRAITSDTVLGTVAGMCRSAGGFVQYLCNAVGVPF
jgi:uncharacterized protein (TIGR02453 family)